MATNSSRVPIVEKILSANDQIAAANRARLDASHVFSINIMASPGAGKTSFILKTIQALAPAGGTITIDARPADADQERFLVRIVDTGPGIPAELHERIFEPFFTSKPSGEGTGLGLPTARRIAEALHGRLELTDSVPGRTEFIVELPRRIQDTVWARTQEGAVQKG